MTKGTPSFGKHNKTATHMRCRRCGNHSFNRRKKKCVSCGFGTTKTLRKYNWNTKHRGSYGIKKRNARTSMYNRRSLRKIDGTKPN